MFPVEHSLSFQPEGFSLLRSLRNGGRIFAAWSARTRAVTVDAERGVRGNMMDVTGRESETRIRKRSVVFLTAKLGYSRESTKSKNHSSSNISAIHKQSETTFCRKYHKFSQPK